MKKNRFPLFVLFTLAFLVLIPNVYAAEDDETVNLSEFPLKLSEMLTIPLFAAQLLSCSIILSLFLLPTVFACSRFQKDVVIPALFVGVMSLSFLVALTWLPIWIFVLICFLIAVMFSDKLTGIIGK